MKHIYPSPIVFGCDPEFFFSKKGKIIGSEKIINLETGLEYIPASSARPNNSNTVGNIKGKIIVDGVQAELNPRPNTCRANLANELSYCFRAIKEELAKDPLLSVEFKPTVKVTQKELKTLNPKSQVFGCAPSMNTEGESKIKVNAKSYPYRSAGGHIHIGAQDDHIKKVIQQADKIIPMLDIVLGNTCVLIDKDPGNKERRKVYGRAGEYRMPSHGIEYRTLSNFWLQSYPLMSFVMSMTRYAVSVVEKGYEKEFFSLVNMKDIHKAINTNNQKLAKRNFDKIKDKLLEINNDSVESFPINKYNIKAFETFIQKDLNHWFKENPLEHWAKLPEGHNGGWETFMHKVSKGVLV